MALGAGNERALRVGWSGNRAISARCNRGERHACPSRGRTIVGSRHSALQLQPPSRSKIDGKKVTKTQDIEVGGLPEAVTFTPDGQYLLAGNYLSQDFSILKVDGGKVTDTGKRFRVPGHPASARMGH